MRTVAGWLVIATVAFGTVGEAAARRAAFRSW